MNQKILVRLLKDIRLFNRKTQKDVSEGLKLAPAYISQIEKGDGKKKVSLEFLCNYAKMFNFPVATIIQMVEAVETDTEIQGINEDSIVKGTVILNWIKQVNKYSLTDPVVTQETPKEEQIEPLLTSKSPFNVVDEDISEDRYIPPSTLFQ